MVIFLYILNIFLAVVSGVQTYYVLKNGGRELNPLQSWAMKTFGMVRGMIIFKVLGILTLGLLIWIFKGLNVYVLIIFLVIQIFDVVNNHRVMEHYK